MTTLVGGGASHRITGTGKRGVKVSVGSGTVTLQLSTDDTNWQGVSDASWTAASTNTVTMYNGLFYRCAGDGSIEILG